MSESKHTPGPWKALDGAVLSDKINQYGNFIVVDCRRELTEEDQANLRLIAAAPELLSALKVVLPNVPGWLENDFAGRPWLTEAINAIIKAEGLDKRK